MRKRSVLFAGLAWAFVAVCGGDVAVAEDPGSKRPDHSGTQARAGQMAGVGLRNGDVDNSLAQGGKSLIFLDVSKAVTGQKVRLRNSNHAASYLTPGWFTAVKAGVEKVAGVSVSQLDSTEVEITLAAGSYSIPIAQTVTLKLIPGSVDDAPWAEGLQLQSDWILSAAPSDSAPIDKEHGAVSKWVTYTHRNNASDARWSILRSTPKISSGESVTFEIDLTNYALTAPTTLQIVVDAKASSAGDADFEHDLDASIAAALTEGVSYDRSTKMLAFGQKTAFPFTFKMTARPIKGKRDFVLQIRRNKLGQIDVAKAGVRLGTLSWPSMTPSLGITQASGEFGLGAYGADYAYPGADRIRWSKAQGFRIIRVPFRFRNIQASSGSAVDDDALAHLDAVTTECQAHSVICLIDMHDYGYYFLDDSAERQAEPGTLGVSNARFANLWAQLAARYARNPNVWFGLMNEPHEQTPLQWVKTANAAVAAIRATGAKNKVIFQGAAWDGAWTWISKGNAAELLKAYDPGNNYAFEAHQYLDSDGSGTSQSCESGSGQRLDPFTGWLKTNGLPGLIGEVGWAANQDCNREAASLLEAWRAAPFSESAGGYIGLVYWAAGPRWPDDYMYLGEPRPFPVGDEPEQLKTLKRHLPPVQ